MGPRSQSSLVSACTHMVLLQEELQPHKVCVFNSVSQVSEAIIVIDLLLVIVKLLLIYRITTVLKTVNQFLGENSFPLYFNADTRENHACMLSALRVISG